MLSVGHGCRTAGVCMLCVEHGPGECACACVYMRSAVPLCAQYLAQEGYETTLGSFRSECASRGEELDERATGGGHSSEMVC